jgi:D-amino-acid dehydrogenase
LVVGAGIVGLSCAFSLQEYGIEVVVVDRGTVGAGSSWGNAGYVSPAHAVPLPDPSILGYGLRAVLDPRSPVSLPLRGDWHRARFLAGLVRHCTRRSWRRGMAAYRPLNEAAVAAYDAQVAAGVAAELHAGDILSGFAEPAQAEALLAEMQGVVGSGQPVDLELLTGEQARAAEPHLSAAIRAGVRIRGQRYLEPAGYVTALAESVRARGGRIVEQSPVTAVTRRGGSVIAEAAGAELATDAVVLASGAWLNQLATPHGVRTPVHAGRGYSFTVPASPPPSQPIHFPAGRLALTPAGSRMRVAGVMEFTGPEAPPAPARTRSMLTTLRPLVTGLDLDHRADEWVGPRPVAADGVPLLGASATDGIYIAGGHGMWGITLGPVTGTLLAQLIATGHPPPELRPLNALRGRAATGRCLDSTASSSGDVARSTAASSAR